MTFAVSVTTAAVDSDITVMIVQMTPLCLSMKFVMSLWGCDDGSIGDDFGCFVATDVKRKNCTVPITVFNSAHSVKMLAGKNKHRIPAASYEKKGLYNDKKILLLTLFIQIVH